MKNAIATTEVFPPRFDGKVVVFFKNEITGEEKVSLYSTMAAARCAETKFHKRMTRVYG